jgi:hypothetical protein
MALTSVNPTETKQLFYSSNKIMFVRKGKKRSSLQLVANTVTRLRKHHKTCVAIDEEAEDTERKRELALLTAELKTMLLEELELRIEQFERWNRDKSVIVGNTWSIYNVISEPTVLVQAAMKHDEEP